MANPNLMAFVCTPELRAMLEDGALRHGHRSPALYARALIMHALGQPETENAMLIVAGLQRRIATKIVKGCLGTIQGFTFEELIGDDE